MNMNTLWSNDAKEVLYQLEDFRIQLSRRQILCGDTCTILCSFSSRIFLNCIKTKHQHLYTCIHETHVSRNELFLLLNTNLILIYSQKD